MVAPLLVAAGLFIASQIGEALIEGFIRQTTEASTIVGKTELAIQSGFMRSVTADALDSMCEVDSHYNVGVSTDGLMEIVERFMRAVAKASLVLTPEIAEELYTELIQEGFSNAVQMSVGGALQSILNTWRGGYPPNPEDLEELTRTLDKLDIDLFALLLAQAGCNIPTSAWKVAKGFDSYVEQKHTDLKAQADTALNRLNSLLSLPYELGDNVLSNEIMEIIGLFREAYIRAQNLIEYVAERALSRLNELRAEVKTVEEWLDWSNEHPEQILITPDEAYYVALENKLEADATMNSYNDTKTKIENSLTNLDVDVSGFMTEVDNLLSDVASHYNNIISKSVIDMTEEINMIKEAFKKLIAYRNAKDSQSSLKSSVVLQ
ncbi:MAG: hypothetical protein ACXQTI_03820 [Candidatus Nezhaarchaeales archaeon]